MKRLLVLAAVAAGFAVAPAPALATDECRGPAAMRPGARPLGRRPDREQLPAPARRMAAHVSARLRRGRPRRRAQRPRDRRRLPRAGSAHPVTPGVVTGRSIVFYASYVGATARAPSFRPHVGCMPGGGGGRIPTAFKPGQPTIRRVAQNEVRPGQEHGDQELPAPRDARRRLARVRLLHAERSEREPRRERRRPAAGQRPAASTWPSRPTSRSRRCRRSSRSTPSARGCDELRSRPGCCSRCWSSRSRSRSTCSASAAGCATRCASRTWRCWPRSREAPRGGGTCRRSSSCSRSPPCASASRGRSAARWCPRSARR